MAWKTCLAAGLVPLVLAGNALAQGVTIGGTDAGGEITGITAIFAGDRFENFRHMDRFVPVSEIPPSPDPWPLPKVASALRFSGDFRGNETSLQEFIALSGTSALLVIQDGRILHESYHHGDSEDSRHISFSMAKSFTSALVGIAMGEGSIDSLDDPVRKYLPELDSPTWDGVSVRHVLQMSTGVRFTEVYTDPASDINTMLQQVPPLTYLEYMNTLGREHEPGTFNHYASINTQLLGILLARATGETLTDYTRTRLWHPLGMEHPGQWILDAQGLELSMGGLSASARDYARLGLLYLNDGRRGDRQILPTGWVKASVTPTEPHLLPGDNPRSSNDSGYQYQWWVPREWDGDFLARGIWGQNIYVHPGHGVVIVKLAADQNDFDEGYKLAYVDYLQQLAAWLGAQR